MPVTHRRFNPDSDFSAISDFLTELYLPENRDGNWFQPVWEYAWTHPWFDENSVAKIGIWEANGRIASVVNYELRLGEAFFQVRPEFKHLLPEMLTFADANLFNESDDGSPTLKVFINDFDLEFLKLVRAGDYQRREEFDRPMTQMIIPQPFPAIELPDGFQLWSLAEKNDLKRIDRVLWRGFNHPGEPPADSLEGRRRMQSGPHYLKEVNIVAEAPSGEFVAFGGLWLDPLHRFAYVEPVATDPDYRRMGLGTAVVMESVRRAAEIGATEVYVGSTMPFYQSMGFTFLYSQQCWMKAFD